MVDAKEIKVPDIQAAGFIIEIVDAEQKPVAGVEFSYAIDGGNAKTQDTDEDGKLKVPKPKSNITLSLAGEEASTTEEEPAKPVEEEPPTSEPVQSQDDQEEDSSATDASEI